MMLLALDTSGPAASVAVLGDGTLLYEARVLNQLTHSRNLMPMVDEALNKSGKTLKELAYIAAVTGPGSFTGVRIGVAAAQGLARGLGIHCIPVNALEAMASSIVMPDLVICPIRDARAGQVYGAAFSNGVRLMPDAAMKLDLFLSDAGRLGQRLFFLGDGALAYGALIQEALGSRALLAPPHLMLPGAAAAAVLAGQRLEHAVPPGGLKPVYLRAPQAERLRKERHEG